MSIIKIAGYAPDPIAEWKRKASKIQGLTAVEDNGEESEEEVEQQPDPKGKPVDAGQLSTLSLS